MRWLDSNRELQLSIYTSTYYLYYIVVKNIHIYMGNINFHTWQPVKIFVRGANFQQKIKSISYALIRKRKMFPLFVFVALFFFCFVCAIAWQLIRKYEYIYIFCSIISCLNLYCCCIFQISPRIRLDGASQSCRNLGQKRLRQGPTDKNRRFADSDCSDWAEIVLAHSCESNWQSWRKPMKRREIKRNVWFARLPVILVDIN